MFYLGFRELIPRSTDVRILFTATQLPDPPLSGGAQRTRLILNELLELGDVDCALVLPKQPLGKELNWIRAKCGRVHVVSKEELQRNRPARILRSVFTRRPGIDFEYLLDAERYRWEPHAAGVEALGDLRDYDLVVARYVQSAANFGLFAHPSLILDVDDYLPDRLTRRLNHVNPVRRIALRRTLKFATQAFERLIPKASTCWVSNEEDRQHAGLVDAVHLPNIPWQCPDFEEPHGAMSAGIAVAQPLILMVGTLSYSANREGLEWFLRTVWDRLRSCLPQLNLAIVGGGVSERDRRSWNSKPGVSVIGMVEQLQPWYRLANVVIAPIRSGAGTNIKVLEAAAAGKCVVATATALRGLRADFKHGITCLEAPDEENFAQACLFALEHPDKAADIGRAAKQIVTSQYSISRFREVVTETVRRVCPC